MKLPDIFNLALLKFYYRLSNAQLEPFLSSLPISKNSDHHSYSTRNQHKLATPQIHSSISIVRDVIQFVNDNLDENIQSKLCTHSIKNISSRFKISTINKYKLVCSLKNCFVCHVSKKHDEQNKT